MFTGKRFTLAAAIVAMLGTSAAIAGDKLVIAALGDVQGKVLVNKGKGYVTAKPGMEIAPGDRVVALDNASAKIVYPDGCVTNLQENNILAVDGKGCATAPVRSRTEPIRLAAALGNEGGAGGGAGGAGAAGAGGGGAAFGLSGAALLAVGAEVFVGWPVLDHHKDHVHVSGQ
jgi:hypothetical protein